ncbi:hypothetical protein QBC46DRAFT_267758 [Diplogelasinospora grovesii]|uniref:J domain-containing protein n=1 Tax=Diplogelasinospora grovesii TaxID=303347 RepID=A0AAN6S1T7_9PEZI|nr:hypothetical protein QBC46DRAFT_267758 [Diplogelasinospora grovesii]
MPDASTSGADASSSNASARNRQHNQGNQERKYTVEQKTAVLRIRRCKPTAFYEILEVTKTCTDAEIKKAYRKQSLLTHPDKNGHEHADEAFKMVARAFSVLGDKEKREKYDRFGTDPDSRFASAQQQQNPFSGFAQRAASGGHPQHGGGGGMWEDEISPEEMFARFFGGGFGGGGGPFGGAFDTGPQFVFNFGGGPGIRVHQFGGARPRGRPRNPGGQEEQSSILSTILGLLPILLLFIFPLLSSLFSGAAQYDSTPSMVFDAPHPPFTQERVMPNFGVPYFLNPQDVKSYSPSKLHSLDKKAEVALVQRLRVECDNEMNHKQRLRDAAQGWFYQDPDKMEVANAYDMPACRRLQKLGV